MRNPYIFSSAALLAAAFFLYFFHVRLTSADRSFYCKLVQESIDLHAHGALEKSPVRQIRKGVRKDIWTIQDGARLHGRIESAQSDVTLMQKKEKIKAVEILHEAEAWMNFGGGIQHLTAKSGTCYFPSCHVEAHHFAANSLPHTVQQSAARQAQSPDLSNAQTSSYHLHKENSALADSATFYLSQKKVILESIAPSRVLFRQAGLEISAPTLHIQGAIQGFGDVRFFFYPEEKNALDSLYPLNTLNL